MLNEKLWNAAAKVYPAVPLSDEARFLPLLELDKGEISSTAAIEIARATRQNAQAIAERLVAELPQPLSGEWRSDLGYIVLRGAQANMLMPEVRSLPEVFPQRGAAASVRDIVALTPDATVPLYARLRLVAAAGVQALLATTFEGSCRLMLSPRPFALIGSRAELVRELQAAVEGLVAEESPRRADPAELLKGVSAGRTTVFTAHHYHDSLPVAARQKLGELKLAKVISLRMPADSWLISRERALPEILSAASLQRIVKQLAGDEAWLRWLFHAASSVPSGDYDPMVALFDECASPLWSLKVLLERFQGLVGKDALSGVVPTVTDLGESHRELLLRALFLPAWCGRAVREGEVLAWMTVVEALAARGHAFLNSPETRRILASDRLLGAQQQIVAGLGFGLSSILPVVF